MQGHVQIVVFVESREKGRFDRGFDTHRREVCVLGSDDNAWCPERATPERLSGLFLIHCLS